MKMEPQSFAGHIFNFLVRQNPALPFSSPSTEKAEAKIWAAGLVLRLLAQADNPTHTLALAALDMASQCPLPSCVDDVPAGVRWGSTRRYAHDGGGYYRRALDAAIEYEFSVRPRLDRLGDEYADSRSRTLRAAFPQTWAALVQIARVSPHAAEAVAAAVRSDEWEIARSTGRSGAERA